uniref:Uncharacterized protein n=1 Tax=Anopheles culicifacies TaxID=139723 RepID=A0A182MK47_9DIPT
MRLRFGTGGSHQSTSSISCLPKPQTARPRNQLRTLGRTRSLAVHPQPSGIARMPLWGSERAETNSTKPSAGGINVLHSLAAAAPAEPLATALLIAARHISGIDNTKRSIRSWPLSPAGTDRISTTSHTGASNPIDTDTSPRPVMCLSKPHVTMCAEPWQALYSSFRPRPTRTQHIR